MDHAIAYLVPFWGIFGKRTIWSVAILSVICIGSKCASLIWSFVDIISAGAILGGTDGVGRGLVECIFFFVFRMCPFAVVINLIWGGAYARGQR